MGQFVGNLLNSDSLSEDFVSKGSPCCGKSASSNLGNGEQVYTHDRRRRVSSIDEDEYGLKMIMIGTSSELAPCQRVFSIDLEAGLEFKDNLRRYYRLFKDYTGMHVTTSCFSTWRDGKKVNGVAKVIPAVPLESQSNLANSFLRRCAGERVRVFFFDDNLELGGKEHDSGICNLRDVSTGEYVDFGDGSTFTKTDVARYTVVHKSSAYANVLVKANILDAIEDVNYFSSIVENFSSPDETLIIFMDVNSTIKCDDTVQGKDLAVTLLGVMFSFLEFTPHEPFDLEVPPHKVRLEKKRDVKSVVKDLTGKAYSSWWSESNCWSLLQILSGKGTMKWPGQEQSMTFESFKRLWNDYHEGFGKVVGADGILRSWFRLVEALDMERHSVVLNSFGTDTRKVMLATERVDAEALQVVVNYDKWDERDVAKFAKQFD
eukprot:TRINITY_DN54747_c0_g1_i1.p1 TRINITY_DN54747_c0_g1~~TRINITY_DN54747_c0_g1_i1.p1  ORF type:complete len:448 (-),score=73.90 TRINITY_DN54747_c0_g1_i1:62-1357(-)